MYLKLDAINYGLNNNRWLLLDEMGLGKTKCLINLAEELKAKRNLKHCLIICGINTLKANWKKEISIHSYEQSKMLGERFTNKGNHKITGIKERIEDILNPIKEFFIITNIETLRSEDFIEAFEKNINEIDMIIVDEIHKCANKSSIQGNNLLKLDAKYKIAATGTLLTNAPINAYLPLKWIHADNSSLTMFKKEYCRFGGFGGHEIIGYQNLDILKEEIEKNSLRRTKDILEDKLPPKTIINESVSLYDDHRKFYDEVKKGVKESCDKIELNKTNLLALVTRLRQATACPSILTTENIKASKLERCKDLVEQLIDRNEKVIVFSTFKETVKQLKEMLTEYNPLICTGDEKDEIISNNVDKFQQNSKYKLLIATHQKLGTGVTLTAASYMISQACDRIYRIGTKKPVFIYNLVAENTIDERVAEILKKKQAISDYIVDDKEDNETLDVLRKYILDL